MIHNINMKMSVEFSGLITINATKQLKNALIYSIRLQIQTLARISGLHEMQFGVIRKNGMKKTLRTTWFIGVKMEKLQHQHINATETCFVTVEDRFQAVGGHMSSRVIMMKLQKKPAD